MGGKAAKERRRLQRLAAQPSNDRGSKNDQQRTAAKQPQTKEHKRFDNPKSASPSSRVPSGFGRFTANRVRFTKDHSKKVAQNQTEAKKPKLCKKPKHLKRKIENPSQDEQERERLLQELKQWEENKLVKHRKKQKTTHSPAPKQEEQKKTETRQPVDTLRNVEDATLQEANDNENQSLPKEEPKKTDTIISPQDDIQSGFDDEEATAQTTNPVFVSDEKKPLVVEEEEASSDSDSDISLEDTAQRQRGRRRRGRQSTEQHTEDLDETKDQAQIIKNVDLKEAESPSIKNQLDNEDHVKEVKMTSKKDDKRRCIGRKPVTDFVIGQRYPGKVIYTKSFGAFVDIGCHSDAFCHVSRVRDDFVKSIDDALTIGDEVSARVVEVDRSGKRITVSLQSDARVEDERKSIEARRQRTKKTKKSKNDVVNIMTPVMREPIEEQPLNESMMTPAQIKRARKLARRATRREQKDDAGITA